MHQFFGFLNDYYDKIYVLSVEAASHRRELFKKRFEGLNYEFFFGADKAKFSVDEIKSKGIYNETLTRQHHRYGRAMKPGEIACAWSHKMMYEDIIQRNFERSLIFEDDALPDPDQVRKIPAILEEIPRDCELLWWGWHKNGEYNLSTKLKQSWYHVQHSLGLLKWDHQIIRNLTARPSGSHLKKAGFHDYTYAYAISRSGAQKLIGQQTPLQYIADNLLAIASTRNLLRAYTVYPAVFLHDALPDGTARDSYIR